METCIAIIMIINNYIVEMYKMCLQLNSLFQGISLFSGFPLAFECGSGE